MKDHRFPLVLTSPHMRGEMVRAAQEALQSNVFGQDFLQGSAIDGEWGPWSHRSTKRAKYWLGYPQGRITGLYGGQLHGYLTGAKPLPKAFQARRRLRLRKLDKPTVGERAWQKFMLDYQARVSEDPPWSNRCYITSLYGLVGPWCAMAVSVWWSQAGGDWPLLGAGYRGREHYVPTIMHKATMGEGGFALVKPSFVRTGDLVLFDWGGDRVPDHVGLFGWWLSEWRPGEPLTRIYERRLTVENAAAAWRKRELRWFVSGEGNTTYEGMSGSQSDGGAVALRVRSINDVARNSRGDYGFVHPS